MAPVGELKLFLPGGCEPVGLPVAGISLETNDLNAGIFPQIAPFTMPRSTGGRGGTGYLGIPVLLVCCPYLPSTF